MNNKPVHTIKFGLVEAAIWENALEDGKKVYNVTISRSFKPDGGEWSNTSSLRRSDLPLAAKALDAAHTIVAVETGDDERHVDIGGKQLCCAPIAYANQEFPCRL